MCAWDSWKLAQRPPQSLTSSRQFTSIHTARGVFTPFAQLSVCLVQITGASHKNESLKIWTHVDDNDLTNALLLAQKTHIHVRSFWREHALLLACEMRCYRRALISDALFSMSPQITSSFWRQRTRTAEAEPKRLALYRSAKLIF